jgi:ribosomal-protein-alanine N-acetyltransferase
LEFRSADTHGGALHLGFADRADADAIAAMSRDLIEHGLAWTYRADRIERYLRHPEAVVLAAREREALAGFAIMHFGDERAHLALLAVLPASRRRGIALAMLAWLAKSAAVAGMTSIHVELREGNHAAHALYRRAGFAETLRVPGYYAGRETAVRMLRVVRPPGRGADVP